MPILTSRKIAAALVNFISIVLEKRQSLWIAFFFVFPLTLSQGMADELIIPTSSPADSPKISEEVLVAWKKLLLYQSKLLGGYESIIDDPQYFLSPNGKKNALPELEANLKELEKSSTKMSSENSKEYACRFPARAIFFEKYFQKKIDSTRCKDFNEWRENIPAQKLSLVFSSFYAQSAATLFGHSLIRIHLEPGKTSGVLDLGLNYAAELNTNNPLIYGFKGVFGGFKGKLSILPYAIKIQEYNNAESRDLWEYELDLKKDEMDMFLAIAWEVGHAHIDYYYLDENCSYILLLLLEGASPRLELASKIKTWAIPSDTIRIANQEPNFIRGVNFRPSNYQVLQSKIQLLTVEEKNLFMEIIRYSENSQSENSDIPFDDLLNGNNTSPESKARLLDVWVDWIDFKEKLAGSQEPKQFKKLRFLILKKRSQLPVISKNLSIEYEKKADPRFAWGPNQLGVGIQNSQKLSPVFSWRPALNSLKSVGMGAPTSLEVRFMEFDIQLYPFQIQDWMLFSLENANPYQKIFNNFSNRFSIGYHRPWQLVKDDRSQFEISLGYGLSLQNAFIHYSFYAEPVLNIPSHRLPYISIRTPFRAIVDWPVFRKQFKSTFEYVPTQVIFAWKSEFFWEGEHHLSYRMEDFELKGAQKLNQRNEWLFRFDVMYHY